MAAELVVKASAIPNTTAQEEAVHKIQVRVSGTFSEIELGSSVATVLKVVLQVQAWKAQEDSREVAEHAMNLGEIRLETLYGDVKGKKGFKAVARTVDKTCNLLHLG